MPAPPPRRTRHPPAAASAGEAKAVARMRRALIRNRGGDGGDRPEYLAYLAARGLWIDGVDWSQATDAEVVTRTRNGEPPEPSRDDAEGRALDALILRQLAERAERRRRDAEAPHAP